MDIFVHKPRPMFAEYRNIYIYTYLPTPRIRCATILWLAAVHIALMHSQAAVSLIAIRSMFHFIRMNEFGFSVWNATRKYMRLVCQCRPFFVVAISLVQTDSTLWIIILRCAHASIGGEWYSFGSLNIIYLFFRCFVCLNGQPHRANL